MSRVPIGAGRIVAAALVLGVLAACGGSPARRAEEAAEELESWRATVALLESVRSRGAVSERFAEQVRRAAAQGRAAAQAKLREVRDR